MISPYDYQLKAISQMKNGSVLCGGVGSGKSLTALLYYILVDCKGHIHSNNSSFEPMQKPRDLYIITTAKKRDSLEWEKECANCGLSKDLESCAFGVKIVIDSWNNIKKYDKIYGAFFIFDEQRVVGKGAWVKAFLNIARKNHWILLSATPGDTWSDYIPVFIANGFYKNRTEFNARHCVFSRFSKYPKIERYIGEKELRKFRDGILVPMDDMRDTIRHIQYCKVDYDKNMYHMVYRDRWDPFENCPIQESGKWIYLLRKVVNSDYSRIEMFDKILEEKKKVVVFYNFVYELEMLRTYLSSILYDYCEWNGQVHEDIPVGERWVYLVQYSAGCEGWNCITTDTIVFFSQNYSYRITEQASGRIDRTNTPYKDLYFFHFKSSAPIDLAIYSKLKNKQSFNESSIKKGW